MKNQDSIHRIKRGGHSKKSIENKISLTKKPRIIAKFAKIANVFINIPMPIENPTKPSRYSFFQGLKNVLTRSGREKSLRSAWLSEVKKINNTIGISVYQNFTKISGKDK